MIRMTRKRAGVGWSVALVLVITSMAGAAAAVGSADPTPSAEATPAATDSASPSASPSAGDSPGAEARATGTATPTTTSEPTSTVTPTPCPLCPPDNYEPKDGTLFNHPFSPASASDIRQHALRTVNSVPSGGSIRIAAFAVNDDRLVNALIAAWKRHVTVQVVVNNHNVTGSIKSLGKSPSFIRLSKTIGNKRFNQGNVDKASFARYCHASCRGHGGNVHYKLFLFSSVGKGSYDPATGVENGTGGTQRVTMMGSPNLTTKAAYGQWNHLDTYVNANDATWALYNKWFVQMRNDTPLAHPYEDDWTTGSLRSWTFPKPGTTAATDPLMKILNNVKCKGATGGTGIRGRTKIRIGAYTFYDNRGRWMSKKVRSLWNAGCDIAIEYAIMGDTVKRTLYSPSGRGRIPMRQVVTFTRGGKIDAYDHAKWIAISGHYGSDPSSYLVATGTTNISDLGFRSDDTQQLWVSKARTLAYFRDFSTLYRSKHSHVPSPTSRLGARIGSPGLQLGKGRYAALEPN